VAEAVTSGPAGFAVTELRCPARHSMGSVYRDARTGELFAAGLPLSSNTARAVQCPGCGRAYLVRARKLRRAIRDHLPYVVLTG
jgi:predicted RNA-binding Zn-ribbon protein involved in translation (DUF1610 family)